MLNIAVYGEHTLSVNAICRLLDDEIAFNPQAIKPGNEYKRLYTEQTRQDVIVYCVNGYSNTLFKEVEKLHRHAPKIKKVLIISMAHNQFIKKLLKAGIDSIVSYTCTPEELTQAIQYAILNQQFISHDLSQMIIKNKYPSCFNSLSQRELEITYMLANGMNVKTVSSELDISPKTVNTYRYRIFNKLDIDRNIDLFRMVSQEAAYMLQA